MNHSVVWHDFIDLCFAQHRYALGPLSREHTSFLIKQCDVLMILRRKLEKKNVRKGGKACC